MNDAISITQVSEFLGILAMVISGTFVLIRTTSSMVEKGCSDEGKARHAALNTMNQTTSKLDLRVSALEQNVVRHGDMTALEARLKADQSSMETRLNLAIADVKADLKEIRPQLGKLLENQAELKTLIRGKSREE